MYLKRSCVTKFMKINAAGTATKLSERKTLIEAIDNTANTVKRTNLRKITSKTDCNCGFGKLVGPVVFQSLFLSSVTFEVMLERYICLTPSCNFVIHKIVAFVLLPVPPPQESLLASQVCSFHLKGHTTGFRSQTRLLKLAASCSRQFNNEKGTGAEMCPASVSGIVTKWGRAGQLLVNFSLPLATVPEVFAKVNST